VGPFTGLARGRTNDLLRKWKSPLSPPPRSQMLEIWRDVKTSTGSLTRMRRFHGCGSRDIIRAALPHVPNACIFRFRLDASSLYPAFLGFAIYHCDYVKSHLPVQSSCHSYSVFLRGYRVTVFDGTRCGQHFVRCDYYRYVRWLWKDGSVRARQVGYRYVSSTGPSRQGVSSPSSGSGWCDILYSRESCLTCRNIHPALPLFRRLTTCRRPHLPWGNISTTNITTDRLSTNDAFTLAAFDQ